MAIRTNGISSGPHLTPVQSVQKPCRLFVWLIKCALELICCLSFILVAHWKRIIRSNWQNEKRHWSRHPELHSFCLAVFFSLSLHFFWFQRKPNQHGKKHSKSSVLNIIALLMQSQTFPTNTTRLKWRLFFRILQRQVH